MDTAAGNGVERKKHTHLISRLLLQKLDWSVHLLHMLQCLSMGVTQATFQQGLICWFTFQFRDGDTEHCGNGVEPVFCDTNKTDFFQNFGHGEIFKLLNIKHMVILNNKKA